MAKFKTISVLALAAAAVFLAPAAANAYVAPDDVSVVGSPTAGATVSVVIDAGAFTPGEDVSFAVTGATSVTLAAAGQQTTTLVKAADSQGGASVDVKLPANASGTYTVTATGLQSGNVATAAITVVAADAGAGAGSGSGSSDDLAFTGVGDSAMLLVWAGSGALLLGGALVVVMVTVRRQRAHS